MPYQLTARGPGSSIRMGLNVGAVMNDCMGRDKSSGSERRGQHRRQSGRNRSDEKAAGVPAAFNIRNYRNYRKLAGNGGKESVNLQDSIIQRCLEAAAVVILEQDRS